MTKIFYITYDDISIQCDAHGIFTFDTSKIFKNISRRYFTMPDWIAGDVKKVFDDAVLVKAANKEDIRKIINQKLVEINNLIVPIARLNKMRNSEIPDWMKIPRYANESDIKFTTMPRHDGRTFYKVDFKIDFTDLVNRVCSNNELIDADVREELVNEIKECVKENREKFQPDPFSPQDVDNAIKEYRKEILALVNKFITKYAEPIIVSDMKDTVGLNPYFAYDVEEKKVTYSMERVLHLLDAMGYAAVDNQHVFEDYINIHCAEIEEEMDHALAELDIDLNDEFLMQNLTLSVNLSILNRLLFIRNNNIRLEFAEGLVYPKTAASQLDIELFYVDACTELMTYDEVLDDLCNDLDVPKSELRGDVEALIDEVKNTYIILRDNNETLDVIYKGVRHTYFDMYDKLHDKYSKGKGGVMLNNTIAKSFFSPSGSTNYYNSNIRQ